MTHTGLKTYIIVLIKQEMKWHRIKNQICLLKLVHYTFNYLTQN